MTDKLTPIIRPEDPDTSNSKSFELSLGDAIVALPEACRNGISILVEEAKTEEIAYENIEAITEETIKPDPMFLDDGRFLECLPAYEGLGAEGGFMDGRPGLHFNDPYWGGVLVFPNNPEYVVFDFVIEPGEEYSPYYLGKRDQEGRGYAIENLEEKDLTKAVMKAQDLIDNGHDAPIPFPKDEKDITEIEFKEGFTGKLKVDHIKDPTGFIRINNWSCEVFSPKGKSLAEINLMETPLDIVKMVREPEYMKQVVSEKRNKMKKGQEEKKEFDGLPF